MRPIKLTVREGCFFNPKFPAPSGGRPILQIRIFDVRERMSAITHAPVPGLAMAAE